MGRSSIIGNKWISIHFHRFFSGAENVGSSRIIETHEFLTFSLFFGGAENVGNSIIIENTQIFLHFHYFFGGTESVGSSRIIGHIWISIHVHCFFGGTESVGSSRNIENTWISIHFHYFFGGAESVGAPESLKAYRFLYIFIISFVERRAWETPSVGSSRIFENTHRFPYIFYIFSHHGERGKLQNH